MKKAYWFCLFILLSQGLWGQNIKLEKGTQFSYRSSKLQETTYNIEQKHNQSESLFRFDVNLEVLEISNGTITMRASGRVLDFYERGKSLSANQWKTQNGFSRDLLKSDEELYNMKAMEFDSILIELNNGIIREKVSFSAENNEPNIIKGLQSLFFPISKNPKVGMEITQTGEKYKIIEKNTNQIIFEKIPSTKGVSFIENFFVVDARTGLLLESMDVFKHLDKQNESRSYTSKDNYTSTFYPSDELVIKRTNLILENKEPYQCQFMVDNIKRDTVFDKTNVTIRGKIKNAPTNGEVSIRWNEDRPGLYHEFQVVSKLDKAGDFEIRLWLDDLKKVQFHCHEYSSFYLMPGDNLELMVDMKKFDETIRARGTGGSSANFMFDKFLFEEENHLSKININYEAYQNTSKLTPEEFKRFLLDKLEKKQNFNGEYQYNLAPEVFLAEYWTDQMTIVNNLVVYPRVRNQRGDQLLELDRGTYDDFLHLIHPDNDMMAFSDSYDNFIRSYVFFFLDDFMNDLSGRGSTVYEDNWIENSYISNYGFANSYFSIKAAHSLKYSMVCDALEGGSWKVFNELYEQFKQEYPHSQKTKLLTEAYIKAEKLAPGRFAYDFELEDLDGNKVRLSDFKGKGVYINFWATWCGPCLSEIEKYSQQMKSFAGNNIEFIYIAIDDDAIKAKKFIEQNQIEGTILIANGDKASLIRSKYLFNSIPHHYVIDVEGRIVSRSAPGPSEVDVVHKLLLQAMEAQ